MFRVDVANFTNESCPPIIQPSPLGMLHMDVVNDSNDARFYKEILRQMHESFLCSCDQGQERVDLAYSVDTVTALRSSLSGITDQDSVTALFVEVIEIGEGRPHPSKQQSQYLVVRLRMLFTDRETLLILFDDQLRLASLWHAGMVLLLFRPYVVMNTDEALFGCSVSVVSERSFEAVPELAHASHYPHTMLPVHFLYGSVTVVAAVAGIAETKPTAGSSSESEPSPARSSSSSITREAYIKDLVFSSQPFYSLIMSFL